MKRKAYPLQESEHDVIGCGEEIGLDLSQSLSGCQQGHDTRHWAVGTRVMLVK